MAVTARTRPVVIEPLRAATTCVHCLTRAISVCNAIGDQDLERLSAAAVTLHVHPGHCFIGEGEVAEHFFNVTAGTAKLFKLLPDGRRQITGFASPGDFLGLAVSTTYAFSAEALEPMRICRFARGKLRTLLDDFPAMEKRLLDVAANELVMAQEQMLLLGRKTARERMASFLVARATVRPTCSGGQAALTNRVALPMTRGDIADYLGLTIETVSRTLTRFKGEGLIDIPNASEIVLLAPPALRALAAGIS